MCGIERRRTACFFSKHNFQECSHPYLFYRPIKTLLKGIMVLVALLKRMASKENTQTHLLFLPTRKHGKIVKQGYVFELLA